nr:uncharacterized protein LOC111512822 [Leptinotarsa decemlineata]
MSLSTEKADYICKHCQKKVVNKVTCDKCREWFHPACLKQARDLKKSECKHEMEQSMANIILTEEDFLREENKLLRQIIQDKDVIITDKESRIVMQNEKITYLENKLKQIEIQNKPNLVRSTVKNTQQSKTTKNEQSEDQDCSNKIYAGTSTEIKHKNHVRSLTSVKFNIQDGAKIQADQINSDIMQIQTRKKLEEVIYLTSDVVEEDSNDDFVEVKRRKNKYRTGNGDGNNDLYGRENPDRKIWLFISKVPDAIEPENIKKYIEERTKSNSTSVKKLTTRNSRTDNQSFIIGIEPQFKQQVYETSFWPKKILFNRFNFNLGRHLLNDKSCNEENLTEDNTNRPATFL